MSYQRSSPSVELLARYMTKHGVDKQGQTIYDLSYLNQIAGSLEKFPFKQLYPYLNLTEFLATSYGLQRVVASGMVLDNLVDTLVISKEKGKAAAQRYAYKKIPKNLKKEHMAQNPYNGHTFKKRIEKCVNSSEMSPLIQAIDRYSNGVDFTSNKFSRRKLATEVQNIALDKIQKNIKNSITFFNMNEIDEEFLSKSYINFLEQLIRQD